MFVIQSGVPQVPYQTVCFVMKVSKQDFIAADAIAKLRQVRLFHFLTQSSNSSLASKHILDLLHCVRQLQFILYQHLW